MKSPRPSRGDRTIDPVRRRSVSLTAEEAVRQAVIRFLVESLHVPMGLISVEKRLRGADAAYRADLVVHTRDGNPWMLVECKAPDVTLDQSVFDQIGNYNRSVKAPYLLVSNGRDHYCCSWDRDNGAVIFLERLPIYES